MARIIAPLTDTAIRKAKPKEKQYKLSDGNNLYLIVKQNGTKFFRFDYTFNSKRKSMSFGIYPGTTLKEARQKVLESQKLIKSSIDPIENKNSSVKKNATTFEAITEKWLFIMESEWKEITLNKTRSRLIQHVFPFIGKKPIENITRLDILEIIERMQRKNIFDLTSRVLNNIERIFKYCVTYGYVEHNIVADIDKKSILKKKEVVHVPAITQEKEIKQLMEDLMNFGEIYRADISTIYALQLIPYIFIRPYNLRFLEWSEVNLENNIINIPADKMKMKEDFLMPLSPQAKVIINKIKQYSLGKSKYVFPSSISNLKTMSENTLNHALMKMGYKGVMTVHGFRSMFSTIAHEKIDEHGYHSAIIEACLAHGEQNKVKAAYNRTSKMKYFKEKKALIEWWGNWLS